MKPTTLGALAFSAFLSFGLKAQTKIEPQVIASSGSQLQSSNLHLDFTLGEFMVQTLGNDPTLTQGFHQPGLDVIIKVIDPSFEGRINIYPNPASETLNIAIDADGDFNLFLYTLHGATVLKNEFSSTTQIDLIRLIPGSYALLVTKNKVAIFSGVIEIVK